MASLRIQRTQRLNECGVRQKGILNASCATCRDIKEASGPFAARLDYRTCVGPGYALFFVSSAFFFNSSKILYRYERRWSESAQRNILWRLMKLLYTELTLQYLGCSFMVITLNNYPLPFGRHRR